MCVSQFESILAYQDATKDAGPALLRAVRLAERNGAKLKVVDFVSEVPRTWDVNQTVG